MAVRTARRPNIPTTRDLPPPFQGYAAGDRPLLPYALLMSIWLSGVTGFLTLARFMNRPLPRPNTGDVVLVGVATFHLSRLITKDAVTSFLRAPFTRFKEPGAPSETNEEPRKESELQHAIGELVSCPFCMATWVAAGFTIGLTFFPRLTRLLAGMFSSIAMADALQLAYGTAHKKADG
jgi:Protein of unknown function (DUF1360)